ncbi:ImmA/IrrE family metallo-endopeptidase [Bacillus sp. m3-13]|uniref:ImmA/IrrE family metallo-endopeptidase n=1 Tax=Bacillus sp. m3-13 TaxID=406124 RepID=UPI0001E8944C|nr:ImmA/IrrE family metallo-endopeptidase [Bacillus sp. m3-13]
MAYVEIKPSLLSWALKRSQKGEELKRTFPKLEQWLKGESKPTLKQLEKFAKSTSTPLGYFFLKEPPVENIPVPHYRTLGDEDPPNASTELIDTIHTMQRRQQFISDFYIENGWHNIEFVGSYKGKNPLELASIIRNKIDLPSDWAATIPSWHDALRFLITKLEEHRIMVMINGVVGNNTHRKLKVEEFRGFVLVNKISPLIFINGSDAKSAQIFTLIHELAHIWIGQSAIVEASPINTELNEIEVLCNRAAAELLCPSKEFKELWSMNFGTNVYQQLARYFKVSTIVVARRALDLNIINKDDFFTFYEDYKENNIEIPNSSGGNFYNNLGVRLGNLFTRTIISEVKAGNLMYRDAYRLTGLRGDTFNKYVTHFTRGGR